MIRLLHLGCALDRQACKNSAQVVVGKAEVSREGRRKEGVEAHVRGLGVAPMEIAVKLDTLRLPNEEDIGIGLLDIPKVGGQKCIHKGRVNLAITGLQAVFELGDGASAQTHGGIIPDAGVDGGEIVIPAEEMIERLQVVQGVEFLASGGLSENVEASVKQAQACFKRRCG